MVFGALGCTTAALLPAPLRADEPPALRCEDQTPVVVAPGAVFGEVRIENGDVFDTDDPAESRRLYRIANQLHVQTRATVVEQRLLFRSGDPYSPRILHESERLLRSAHFLYDATICVLGYRDGVVDVKVATRDVWTLRPGLSFGRSGGQNKSSIELEDKNLLGRGISLSVAAVHGVDRDSTVFQFKNMHTLGRWLTLDTTLTDSSDGHTAELLLERPFYALDTRRASGFQFRDDDRLDPLYDLGEVVDEFRHETSYQRVYWGWSPGLAEGWTRRWTVGIVRDFEHFAPSDDPGATTLLPTDRELQYPFASFELQEDHFVTERNHNQVGRTEDFCLGTRIYGELGLLQEGLGSDRAGFVFDGAWSDGRRLSEATQWLANATLSGRMERDEGLVNAVAGAGLAISYRQSKRRLFFASLQGSFGHQLDLDNQMLIGGDSGLRGYPLRYQGGDRRALLTIEQRYFTSWYPLRLFHVAGAAFFDAGRAWGTNPVGADDLGWLKDVGVGLRLGSSRSGSGTMVHVDLAMPLDGDSSIDSVQLVIETKHGF